MPIVLKAVQKLILLLVSDVFHNGSPEHPLWEFKHGQNNFKRGDLVGLREIKRRASRHNLVHHPQKPPPSQPGTPAEPMPPVQDGGDPRVASLERTVHDLCYRLDRSEATTQYMNIKHRALLDSVTRLLHYNQELSRIILGLVNNPDNPHYKDGKLFAALRLQHRSKRTDNVAAYELKSEISRQTEMIRGLEDVHEPPYSASRSYFSAIENAPVSPRQLPQDDTRRSSLAVPQSRAAYDYRPQVPSNLSISTKRPYGSIGGSPGNQVDATPAQASPSRVRPAPPPPPPGPQPLSAVEPPPGSLLRRHTSADIRHHGWQPQQPPPFSSGPPSSHLPSSPSHLGPPDDRLRESLSQYSFPPPQHPHSRPPSPPPPSGPPFSNGDTFKELNNFQWDRATRRSIFQHDSSAPPTRRGSMAHILNDDNDSDPRGDDDRKRKRLM